MITAVVPASEANKLNSVRRAQGWPPINSLSQSNEPGSPLAKPFLQCHPANSTPIGRSIGAWLTPTGTILDFVRARNGRSTAQRHEAPWNGNDVSLRLIDLVLIAGLFLITVFFYPAMAWILLLS